MVGILARVILGHFQGSMEDGDKRKPAKADSSTRCGMTSDREQQQEQKEPDLYWKTKENGIVYCGRARMPARGMRTHVGRLLSS